MASTFTMEQRNGTAPGTPTDPASYMDLLSADEASSSATHYQDHPISIPASGYHYSHEAYFRGHWSGSFNSISNVKFWRNGGTLAQGFGINAGISNNYQTPVNTASSIAAAACPTTESNALQLTYASGYSNYVVLQAQVAAEALPGDAGPGNNAYTWQWDET